MGAELPPATDPAVGDFVRRAQSGDHESLNVLYAWHWPTFLACAHAQWQRDGDEAQDLCQVACLKSVAHLAALRHPDRFRSWVMGFIVNEARNWRRTHEIPGTGSSAVTLDQIGSMTATPPSPLTQAERDFMLAELASVTRQLTGRDREVGGFILQRLDQTGQLPTVEQIAERFGLSHTTAQRARESVLLEWRQTLGRYGFEDCLHE